MKSKLNFYTEVAHDLGYRVVAGKVLSPFTNRELKLTIMNNSGCKYYKFNISFEGKKYYVKVHKLVAYQKYGKEIFEDHILVRHRDGNSLNNLEDNIITGSYSDNMYDIPIEIRERKSITAATVLRKFTDTEMEEIKKFHRGSYKETMETFGITSKGTLWYILNAKYKTKV